MALKQKGKKKGKKGPGRPKGSASKKSSKVVKRKKRSEEVAWQIVPFGKNGTTFAFIENGRKIATRFTIGTDHVTINDTRIEGDEGLRDFMMTVRRIGKKYSD